MSSSQPRRGFIARRLQGWMLRHQLPSNFAIHMVGIPMTLVAIGLLAILPWDMWWVSAASFVLGYFLQWVGHCWEGNDMGEWAAIKKLLGLPYVGISPRWNP